MSCVVFIGPSRPAADARRDAAFTFAPPARCGDIYRTVRAGATVIGIVDGVFEGARSTWHKEILWALSRGVAVAGAASMGALRAAEMHTFGMIGIGRVFSAYRKGALEDDDEVAVIHAPAELGYRPLSDAMVNIRATLGRAQRSELIDTSMHDALIDIGKSIFFKERSFERMLDLARSQLQADLTPLSRWLSVNRVNVKEDDARALLRRLPRAQPAQPRPPFVGSRHWDAFVGELEASYREGAGAR